MIKFNEKQKDAFKEIANVGMSKAAKQLSMLLNSPIKILVPEISFMKINEISKRKIFDDKKIYSIVYQKLSGDINGYSALVLLREYTNLLTMAIMGKTPEFTQEEARACEEEAMLEIGNVIITTCTSVIANMLGKKVSLSLPVYTEEGVLKLLKDFCDAEANKNFIVSSTQFDTENNRLSGHLFLIMTEDSAEDLWHGIKKLIAD